MVQNAYGVSEKEVVKKQVRYTVKKKAWILFLGRRLFQTLPLGMTLFLRLQLERPAIENIAIIYIAWEVLLT